MTPEEYAKGEELREKFEKETGKKWLVLPVCHGELGFASWDYQLWLESCLAEAEKENTERFAKLILSMELATGHGDDWDSLALELRTQWEELRSRCIAAEKERKELRVENDNLRKAIVRTDKFRMRVIEYFDGLGTLTPPEKEILNLAALTQEGEKK